MAQERNDYSGPFIRHFRYEDFSKEFLGKLEHIYSLALRMSMTANL
jgi:hypothetical protein